MNIKKIFTKKKIIWTIIILLVIGGAWYFVKQRNSNKSNNLQTAFVSKQDLEKTVLATGQVVSSLDLNLSFQTNGVVKELKVKVGDNVKKGDVLATLDQENARASLISAQGALAQAQANYQRIINGATSEQIDISQKAVDSAQVLYNNYLNQLASIKKTTAANIKQAQKKLDDLQSMDDINDHKRTNIITNIDTQLSAIQSDLDKEKQILEDNNLKNTFSATNVSVLVNFKNNYASVQPLLDIARNSLSQARLLKNNANLNRAVNDAINALRQSIISLNYCFSALENSVINSNFSQSQLDAYKSSINGKIIAENAGISTIQTSQQVLTDALTNAQNSLLNTKLSAEQQIVNINNQINSAKASLAQAQASMAQLKAKAQKTDIDIARAQILSAKGSLALAQANFNKTILKSPADGTITKVDIKIGEQANALQEVMILQNINSLHVEAYVSEANVADLHLNQNVDYTFDALGPDRHFTGKILSIDPASTIVSGVINYLVKSDFSNVSEIKPGMTANMTILIAKKNNVLAVPSSAIINVNGKTSIRLLNKIGSNEYHSVPIEEGLQADGGLTEITSGLKENDQIVTYIK